MEDCEVDIIEKGGYIYFALYRGIIVGCFSLIPISTGVYELSKIAVDPEFQGLHIGQQLLNFAIEQAKKRIEEN